MSSLPNGCLVNLKIVETFQYQNNQSNQIGAYSASVYQCKWKHMKWWRLGQQKTLWMKATCILAYSNFTLSATSALFSPSTMVAYVRKQLCILECALVFICITDIHKHTAIHELFQFFLVVSSNITDCAQIRWEKNEWVELDMLVRPCQQQTASFKNTKTTRSNNLGPEMSKCCMSPRVSNVFC